MVSVSESIKISNNVKDIRRIIGRIIALLQEKKVEKSHIFDIRLCMEEAVLNAIEHGNKKRKSLSVLVSFVLDDERIEVTVEDEGEGFDRKSLPDPTKDENILRSHGRGIYLIHKLMDRVVYNDKGNRVKLTKYLK